MVMKVKNQSIWLDGYDYNDYVSLDKDITCDILIIGGGITGLSTLYNLRKSNLNVVLVEANLVGSGVSGYTTGKINFLQELIYSDILKQSNYEKAKLYYDSQKYAIKKIVDIINKEKILCDLEKTDSFVFTNEEKEIEKIKKEKELLTSFGERVEEYNKELLYVQNKYAIKVSDTYVFHPLKYLLALKKIIRKFNKPIYEKTKVNNIIKNGEYYNLQTDKYVIKAKKIVLACHYPFFLFPYFLPIKTNIEKSYIIASLAKNAHKTYITSNKPTTSIRYHKDYLIYLSNSRNISNKIDEKENYEEVIKKANNLNLKVKYIWKNDDLITLDKIPYIGYVKKNDKTLLIGTGYNTWGMTNGSLAGFILSDLIMGNTSKYASLTDPLRVIHIKNTLPKIMNIFYNSKGFLKSKIKKNKDWYQNVKIKNINGKSVAIYKDNDKEYKVYNTCPHMGCSLIFNAVDKTWDCPCHASRFSLSGKVIKGPSTKDITYNEKNLF